MFWKKTRKTQHKDHVAAREPSMFQATTRIKGSVLFPDILLALLRAEIGRQMIEQTVSEGELGDMIAMRVELEREMKKYPRE